MWTMQVSSCVASHCKSHFVAVNTVVSCLKGAFQKCESEQRCISEHNLNRQLLESSPSSIIFAQQTGLQYCSASVLPF